MSRFTFVLRMVAALVLYWLGLILPTELGGGVWIMTAIFISAYAGRRRAIDMGVPAMAGIPVCIPVLGWIYGLVLLMAPNRKETDGTRASQPERSPLPLENGESMQNCSNPRSDRQNFIESRTMKLCDYSISIPEADEVEGGYAVLKHATQYSIELRNDSSRRCDAVVRIDGGLVGIWRVDARDVIRLERPSGDTGRFTFFRADSHEAKEAALQADDSLGLISVEFRPELDSFALHAAPLSDVQAGGTGLTGESSQRFSQVEALDYDEEGIRTIHLRLVAKKPTIRPLHPRATPIPPPV